MLLYADRLEECLALAEFLVSDDPKCAAARVICGWVLQELERPEAALDQLRCARDLLQGGCLLPQFLRDDFIGVCEVGIDLAAELRCAARPEERAARFAELMAWISALARLVPDALLDIEADVNFADVQSAIRILRGMAQAGSLGMEAGK